MENTTPPTVISFRKHDVRERREASTERRALRAVVMAGNLMAAAVENGDKVAINSAKELWESAVDKLRDSMQL